MGDELLLLKAKCPRLCAFICYWTFLMLTEPLPLVFMLPSLSVLLSACWDTGFLSKPDGLSCLWQPPSPGLLSYLSLLGPSSSLLLPPGVPVFRSQPILSWAILTINTDPAMSTKGWNSRGISRTNFPGDSESKESAFNAGSLGMIPGSGRSPGERNGNPLQYLCLENSMDRGAWRATAHAVIMSLT